ncbi:Uncharacterized protein DBV15_01687 [Temnothorax longispinosus]|uniref:Zinc finger protein n=1 Tax=Temnothorax longispinosus TaxID=300112 RepID=A0A4S2L209_9HYME|nr:Uncharacterized protein DBV15_01687 [Temnothorax longispinosus]
MSDEPSNMAERPSRCRICLADHGCMTSLMSDRVEGKLKDLIKCTCIDIKYEENLPGVVCHVCLYKLDMWGEFKERFVQSNKALLEQLEVSETSDNAIKDPASKDESCTTKNAKRKRKIGEDNISDTEKKDQAEENETATKTQTVVSEKNDIQSDKISSTGVKLDSTENIAKKPKETYTCFVCDKIFTDEELSLIEALASDDVQLSPVQKARAKTNADKETERQKKVAKVLKNLETNLTEKYIGIRDGDTDSDARRTRLSKELHLQQRNKISLMNKISKEHPVGRNGSSLDTSMEREHSPTSLTDNVALSVRTRKSKIQKNDGQTFTPQSVKSELVIGDTKFAVTSTLILVDPSNLNSLDVNNLPKDSKNPSPDESNREKNTDIIDAVQLRRVNPVKTNANNKANSKSKNELVERCLNIEVEGHELMVLKRVQCELADFVKNEMKHKILGTSDGAAKMDNFKTDSVTCTRQKLDQKLKDIIELAIKKNIEPSTTRQMADVCSQESTRFSPALIKMAVHSPRYQPKVVIKRLDTVKEKTASTSPQKDQAEENETATKTQTVVSEKNDIQSDKISSTGVKLDSTENIAKKPKETYTCFVCDKIFTDEEVLKDHLQKHCDDLSEGEQSNSKEQYQCGICSKILESDEALEEHVGKHLFDDEDDNPNLISIDQSTNDGNNKSKETEAYQCGQCSATFDSEMLLEMHMQEHEEEVAIAEWEKQGMKVYQYQCMLCDELFNAEKELAEHLDIHNANAQVCVLCDKPFRTLEDLQEHVATH